jgi:hypothetical protein
MFEKRLDDEVKKRAKELYFSNCNIDNDYKPMSDERIAETFYLIKYNSVPSVTGEF